MLNYLKVLIISAVPLIEQRGAIPAGIFLYHMNPWVTFIISFLGSMIPVPFILLLFNTIFKWMKKIDMLKGISNFIENKIQKNSGHMEKYKELGLITFIAIPLPTTGLWTGSAVAAVLGLDFKKSIFCAAIGGIISAFAITIMCSVFRFGANAL